MKNIPIVGQHSVVPILKSSVNFDGTEFKEFEDDLAATRTGWPQGALDWLCEKGYKAVSLGYSFDDNKHVAPRAFLVLK